jgi:hypothetical protein
MNKKILFRILGLILFLPSVVLGMFLFGGAAWADVEAVYYGFQGIGGEPLSTLDCPVLMTTSDVGSVAASFRNPNDIPVNLKVCGDFSSYGLFRTECMKLSIDENQTKQVSWKVTSADIDLRNFIFAQITNYYAPGIRSREGTCGIMVLDLPQFTGRQVFTFAMIVILVGIVVGLTLWEVLGKPYSGKLPDITRAMKTLGILVLLGLLLSFMGNWMFAILFFALSVLAIGVILGFLLA